MKETKNIQELKSIRKNIFNKQSFYNKFFYFRYFKGFYNKNKILFLLVLFLLVLQIILELNLVILSRNSFGVFWEQISFFIFFVFLVIVFLLTSYFSLKKEKTLSVYLANDVRKRIVSFYLSTSEFKIDAKTHSNLMAKISYHLPLLSSSVSRVFFSFIRWFFYFLCFIFLVYFLDFNFFFLLTFYLSISFLIFLVSYFISKKYISKEVTFYSQIIKHISFNIMDHLFLKRFSQESNFFKKFDKLVEFDSYFRIRRDIWFRFASKIIFLLIIFIYFFYNFWSGDFFKSLYLGNFNYLFFIFLVIYLSRSFYESSVIGLYMYPAKLGISLAIVPGINLRSKKKIYFKERISFQNRKTKLFPESAYYRYLFFNFEKSKRYLFFGNNFSGKSSLAMVFSFLRANNSMSWKVKLDNKRFDYSFLKSMGNKPYYFDPNFKSQRSLIEFITGRDKDDLKISEIENSIKIISNFSLIFDNLSRDGNYNTDLRLIFSNSIRSFAIHCAYCLVNKPKIIVIDNLWLDLNYDIINNMLVLLEKELKDSIIVAFSNKNNNILKYNKKYEILQKEIREI